MNFCTVAMANNRQWFHEMTEDDGVNSSSSFLINSNSNSYSFTWADETISVGDFIENRTDFNINTKSKSKGLGHIHSPYSCVIADFIKNVFHISTPNDCQLLLIQSMIFNNNANNHRVLGIRCTSGGKILHI